MPTIHTRCPACRAAIALAAGRCALLGDPTSHVTAYGYVCPRCQEPVVRPADRQMAAMLKAGGASARGAREPAVRPLHPERPAGGPPLTVDDLIDFHALLGAPDWYARLVSTAGN